MPSAIPRFRALVVVLGDVGRSPRMVNHVRALRRRGWSVTLAGYGENPPPPDLADDAEVRVVALDAGGGGLARALCRLAAVARRERWTAILVQNPPGFPALLALSLAGRRGAQRVVDWHNLGSTLLALRPGPRRQAAGIYGWCERRAARLADRHWAVSAALAKRLPGLNARVVHDRPSLRFRDAAGEGRSVRRREWWSRVFPGEPAPEAPCWIAAPSSWGPDEDTLAMIRATAWWQSRAADWGDAPRVAIVATGKGPAKVEFERAAARVPGGPIALRTAWVPAAEYPAFLALADAGLCLHRSSSGLDLPIKLADFRGAGRKALVLDYGPVLTEVFRPGADGWTFRNDEELAAGLRRVALAPEAERAAPPGANDSWEEEWDRQLGPWAEGLESGRTPS